MVWAQALKRILGAMTILILVGCQTASTDYTIERKFQQGERWRYSLVQTVDLPPRRATVELTVIDTVLEVHSDGSALIEREIQGDPAQLETLRESFAPFVVIEPKTRWKVSPRGKEELQKGQGALLTSVPYAYPDRPVPPGAQWGMMDGIGSLQTSYISQLVGVEELDGVPCYKIRTQAEPLPDSLPAMQGEILVYLDRQNGWTRQIEGTLQMQAGELKGTVYIKVRGAPEPSKGN
ncbi:MAG: hypothetical protein SNJ72_04970 [Fimbriimonadales bacterium]